MTPALFNKELAALGEDVPEIVVRINSGGGDVFAANAIYTRLKDHSARITVKVDGWAASAATIIAMAGDEIKIARNGVFMIHDPAMTVWDTFHAEDFEKMAQELRVIKQSIVNTYAIKTGKDEKDIETLMADETWWTGDEAVEAGFCDVLMFEDAQTIVENSSKIVVNNVKLDVSGFKTLPKQLLNSPHNPGGFTNNSALSNTQNKKEDESMAETPSNSTITTVEALEAAYPDLVKSIRNAAVEGERNRIKDIKEMSLDGFEDIAEDAMFGNPTDAATVAMKIINEQKKQGGQYLAGRAEDAAKAGEIGASAAGEAGENSSGQNAFDAAIDALFPAKK